MCEYKTLSDLGLILFSDSLPWLQLHTRFFFFCFLLYYLVPHELLFITGLRKLLVKITSCCDVVNSIYMLETGNYIDTTLAQEH